MSKQSSLKIYEVLRASKAFVDFDDQALQDFSNNIKPNILPALASVDLAKFDITERLFVVFEGHLLFTVKNDNATDEVIYELRPGDVLGTSDPPTGFRNAPKLQAACETTIIGIPWTIIDQCLEKTPSARLPLEDAIWYSSRRAQIAGFLHRLFGEINAHALVDFEEMVEWQSLSSGTTLFRQGDPADGVYLVFSGYLRVALEKGGQNEKVINEIKAGETIGEIAFLTGERRSATVYAVRDTVLARISNLNFEKLLGKYPHAMKHIALLLSKRLQSHARLKRETKGTIIFCVVPSHSDCPLGEATQHMVKALTAIGPTLHLDAASVDSKFGRRAMSQLREDEPGGLRLAQWLLQQETHYRFVVYEADPDWTPWTQRTIRLADQVVIFTTSNSEPRPGAIEVKMDALWISGRAPHLSLVLIHPDDTTEPNGTLQWLTPRNVSNHYHVRAHSSEDYARLARILAGRAITLVLGGGGARGYAHIGMVRALEEIGIPIDIVGGTSMGAILGGLIAMRYNAQQMQEGCKKYITGFFDYTLPLAALLKGKKVRASLNSVFGKRRIEDLWLPYFCVATNLTQADQIVHQRGSVAECIRSSMSLPGILVPCYYNGDLLVDGGIVNNLPFDIMRTLFKGNKVIAVDVEPKRDLSMNVRFATEISGWSLLLNRFIPFRKKTGIPSILNVLIRSATLASVYTSNRLLEQDPPDLYLYLPVDAWGTLAFDDIDEIVTRGYEASLPKLQKVRKQLLIFNNTSA